jgi:hypothetical protein
MKPITVKELIAVLKKQNPNACVGMSRDSEGNGFSLMANQYLITEKCYLRHKFGAQDSYIEPEQYDVEGEVIEDLYENKIKKADLVECIMLWPTN